MVFGYSRRSGGKAAMGTDEKSTVAKLEPGLGRRVKEFYNRLLYWDVLIKALAGQYPLTEQI
jgi:hypothetical protein